MNDPHFYIVAVYQTAWSKLFYPVKEHNPLTSRDYWLNVFLRVFDSIFGGNRSTKTGTASKAGTGEDYHQSYRIHGRIVHGHKKTRYERASQGALGTLYTSDTTPGFPYFQLFFDYRDSAPNKALGIPEQGLYVILGYIHLFGELHS